ncbi:uncharacterized protein LOC119069622 [Bradysia coprophila]|uniref:uncharacterized protein LOC119069622 n=1 Tax=Bradysia coprophila TaxID=38358 RepID=UPI00187D86CB|nr:uncharacterized protein LOC119069622 [Bradysia coprophila]XP_037029612.1 uncharacterized protein LOC119069622 [Bradysia coprophila]XP_037029613.1 uncharacterized protein LOC119069622 [Bradysia coprophila]XP_037029614.1 uncharacterized protein LOC119069622 [Bradysia coprophila]XP_037029615.1 uncharacterized protein LOC119069622 [Bradysia coprophila]XP_037029616.1 uncharacterized protein LOC119069622 [Bradysia coprophila]
MKMVQILLMLFLITIKCNKVVCIERTSKINNAISSEDNLDSLNNRAVQTHSQKLSDTVAVRETSFNHKNNVRNNHQTNSDINGNPTQHDAVPPAFLLPDNGSASNRSVSQVPIFLLSKTNEHTDQVSADVSVKFLNEFQPNLNHINARNRRDSNRQNICGNECKCRQENNFDTVDCDFLQETSYVLGPNKYITRSTTSLLIKLKHPKSALRFDSNFFDNNNINRILIECPADNRVQIEVTANAFVGNEGPFPEIDIVNCFAIVLRSNAFQGEFKLNITKSSNVMIFKNAFSGTKFHGHFERITNFSPDKEAFSNAEAKILILNCKIDTLHRLDGRLKEIKFTNTEIQDISSGAFDAIEITSIVFENCSIGSIHMKATTDRLFTSYLEITGCSIETIETKAIDGSGISEVLLRNNRIKWIKENAIHLTTVTAVITNNTIHHLNVNWFKVKGTNVTITNNKFGNFNRITVDRIDDSPVHCLFGNNFISIANKGSLNFTDCRMKDVYINSACKCSQFSDWLKELSSVDLRSVTYCQVDSALLTCLNSSLVNVLKFENDICNESTKTLDCAKKKVTTQIHSNFIDTHDINERKIDVILISIIGGCSLLFILILIGIIVLVKKIYRSRPITIPLSDMSVPNNHLGSMKQSKSFSNDDRDIINQTMGIIKEKQTPERYDQIYNNTKKLLGGNLTELDKVTTIGEIVRTLEECENTGSDFVAFTDILYKHLAPKDNNQNDPIYSEPNVLQHRRNNDEEENVFTRDDNQMGLDHIYAEPNSVQQPLLTNEYALPIDRSDQTNVYTEPIPNFIDKPRHLISPYAIATNLETAPPESLVYSQLNFPGNQPSTSKNLPDVLNPTNASALHMKNQLTHLTRSPTTNRKIPKYTIPSAKFKKMKSDQQHQSSEESNSHSDHSGGSDITYKVDEVIEYADA